MSTVTQQDCVTIDLSPYGQIDCMPLAGRITAADLVFKNTEGPYPLPGLFLVVTIKVGGKDMVYQQVLGQQQPNPGDRTDLTQAQITALMRVCRVVNWQAVVGTPVLVLQDTGNPAVVHGVCDVERKRFCHHEGVGPVLFYDE